MPLKYLLDTNICIYLIKNNSTKILKKFEQITTEELAISIVTYGELLYGIQKSKFHKHNLAVLHNLITYIRPLPMPINAAEHYGNVRTNLEIKGQIIGNNDLWIASHALALDIILVTNNTKEFKRIPTLQLENWS